MKIIKFKKVKNNQYEILLKDGSILKLYDDVILKYNLIIEKKIPDNIYEEILEYNSSLDAYYVAIKYLNRKMRTKLEIEKYLKDKEYKKDIINLTLNKLESNKIINDNDYMKAYINDQVKLNKIGPNKIIKNLKLLGIANENVYSYIESIDDDIWKEKIRKIIDKKIKSNNNYSVSMLKNKIIIYLINEGYDKNIINSVLEGYNIKNSKNIILKEYNKQKKKLSKKYDGEALKFQIKMKLKAKGFDLEDLKDF